jgi:serine O-acetyltransferase
MKLSIAKNELCSYYSNQLNNFFPDTFSVSAEDIGKIIDVSLDRLHYCFKHVAFSRYNTEEGTLYNHLYADHNIILNWFLANAAYKLKENPNLASKLYYLNKVMHSFDCMYDTALPDIFLIFHGAGTMLGKAIYRDFFVSLQGCTVGSHKGAYPNFGIGVSLTANSSVIGNCQIGSRVSISTRTSVFSKNIDADSSIYMNWDNGKLEIKPANECYAQQFFNVNLKLIS